MQKFLRSLALLLCLALLCGALAEAPGLLSEGVDMEVSKQSETVAMNEEDKSPAAAESSVTPESSATPEPSASAESSATPEPSATAESSATPEPSITPEPSATPEPVVIEPAQEKLVLGVGEKRSVADWRFISGGSGFDGSATYKSSNKRIATVDADGMVKALRNGKAVISVQAAGAVCEIQLEVKNAPKSVSLKVEKNVLGVGEETKLTVTTPAKTAMTATRTSPPRSCCTGSANGRTTAMARTARPAGARAASTSARQIVRRSNSSRMKRCSRFAPCAAK